MPFMKFDIGVTMSFYILKLLCVMRMGYTFVAEHVKEFLFS